MGFDFGKSLEKFIALAESIEATIDGAGLEFATAMEHTLKLVQDQTKRGRKLMYIGNGGSAAICSHMATDYMKNGKVRAVAFNDASLLTCLSNDYSYVEAFQKCVERFADAGDVLIAISSSGRSRNILNAVEAARAKGCPVVTLSGFDPNNPLRSMGDVNFYVGSHQYSHVENLHLLICHVLLDALMAQVPAPVVA